MEFRILGPLEVRDGERVLALGGNRRRAVLGLLLLDANRVVSVDRLVDGVWGDSPPASAHASLQNHLFRLRQELGDRLVTRPPGYFMRVGPGELDVDRFRRLVDEAHGSEPAVAAERLREALALWRGPPLADLAGEPVGAAAAHLDELRLAAVEERVEADLALGRHALLVAELEELVGREPYRERFRRQLALALYRSGRQADALEAYADARKAFADELGTEPSHELKELQRAVLNRDPALDAPPEAGPPPALATPVETRRTVTVLIADVAPEDAPEDAEARRTVVLERTRAAERELERHGAAVQVLGSGQVLAAFGVPAAQDDDSLRAVQAALALQARRVGLATGEVVTGDPLVSGPPVDEAARLRDRAGPGQVLAGARTMRLVRHAVTASEHDGLWAIEAVDPEATPVLRRLDTPIVGRDRELARVTEAFERASADARAQLVTIFGAPGIGKTRLAAECVERLEGLATVAVAHCNAWEQGLTYAPLREALEALAEGDVCGWIRERLGAEEGGAPLAEQLVAAVTGAEPAPRMEDIAWAVRRLLAGLGRDRPLLLVFEDVHWAAPALLDLVESLVELTRAPLLVVCLARPDLLDARPHWGGGGLSSTSIVLDALTDTESEALLGRIAPGGELDAAARDRILAVAEGNPLFIEQLLAAALEEEAATIPDSIQTLLAARLDRLPEPERAVAQAAAVCGRSFSTEAVAELVGADPSASLLTLVRRDLVRPGDAGSDEWAFRHSLIRDVAYGSLPKWRRAELHERLAERAVERGIDVDVSAGYHFDHALRARREVGEAGAAVDRLAARAAEHLRRAGLAAYDSDDSAAAASLLGRASELLPRTAAERIELLPKLGEALIFLGEREAAGVLVAEARAVAVEVGDARLLARSKLGTGVVWLWSNTAVAPDSVIEEIDEAVRVLEEAGDYEGLALAELLRFHALDRARRPGMGESLRKAFAYARKAGARRIEHQVTGWICVTLPRSSVPVDGAIAQVREILADATSSFSRAAALGALGLLRAMQGEFDEARALVEDDRRMLEELGLLHSVAAHSIAISEVETMAGEDAAAERILRAGLEAVTALGDEHSTMNVAWRLGLALARQGSFDEAERFALMAGHAAPRGLWVDIWWRIVLAQVEAHRGNVARAQELVDEAREPMVWDQGSGMQADALLESAEALRVAGREEEAAELIAEAAGIAERLGYTVARRRAEEAQRAFTT